MSVTSPPMTGGLDDAGWLEAQFAGGRSVVDVAGEVGVTPRAVRYAAHRVGVVLPQLRARLDRQCRLEDPDWLRRQRSDGVTVTELAHQLGVARHEVVRRLDECGISSSDRPRVVDDEQVRVMVEAGWSFRAIADHLGVATATIRRSAARSGVRSRHDVRRVTTAMRFSP